MGENNIEEWDGEPLSQEELFNIIVVDAEICKKEQVLKDTGEEYHYLNDIPEDKRSQVIATVVKEALKDYEDPTRNMTQTEMMEFDLEMRRQIREKYGYDN